MWTGRIDALITSDGVTAIIMSPPSAATFDNLWLAAKVYAGGTVETITKVTNLSTYSNMGIVSVRKDNKLYFARVNDNALYCFGQNRQGRYILTHDTIVKGGTSSTADVIAVIYGLSFVGDCMYVGYIALDNTYRLMATEFLMAL